MVVVKRDDGSRGPDVTWTPKKKPLAEAYSACLRLSEPIGGERELAAADDFLDGLADRASAPVLVGSSAA